MTGYRQAKRGPVETERLPLSLIAVAGLDFYFGAESVRRLVVTQDLFYVIGVAWLFIGVALLRLSWKARIIALWLSGLGIVLTVAYAALIVVGRIISRQTDMPVVATDAERIILLSQVVLVALWLVCQLVVLTRPHVKRLL